jgi:uncharacterized protein YmfQ (DUF2313 family)
MARTVEQFRDVMLALMPRGFAWPTEPNSNWGQLFMALAEEFTRIDIRNESLLAEFYPRTTLELLEDWEKNYGLPGQCIHEVQTLNERHRALLTKYRLVGRQDKQFFIDVAADLGYVITITEYDVNHPGPQTEYNGFPLTGSAWNYVWQINAQLETLQLRTYPSSYSGPYGAFSIELLECTLRGLAHDHRALFFAYT